MNKNMVLDKWKRPLQDLRISVIDRCNFRCTYCMPKEIFGKDFAFLPPEQLLTFDEIERLVKIFAELGVKKIRLTGGEPLLRKDLPQLIEKINQIKGIEDIALTTNAVHLVKQASALKEAGLQRINVSLDALDPETFKAINDRGVSPDWVIKGIDAAIEAGLEVKVNMVVKKGMNDHEVLPMAAYFKERGITLRFIEFMDVGQSNGWDFSKVITKKQMVEQLSEEFELEPVDQDYFGEVAKRYRYKGTNTEVGFITSVSESFCSSCTRARIAADGKFFTCLFATEGFDLKELVRSDKTDEEVDQAIRSIWGNRTDRYSDERTEETVKNRKKIEMSYIGG
ncbi:GTP 3',8-cyclase MoaA [Aquibacillus koreensis]|uniref:GTP 3',8-cyclase n=1 Tax=Aquibacillus koreensis TaxID=279446 RepID=A0A9X3WKH3_9BACI|nr:GTP 3',8-cyclase MoaA [Aquibacillus koreensis]MCT2536801.1 GTP 3',8-cyclase MoaA [Aquibacillus koreensis]MDC3421442.1 GTP 3',8-cyclase MoaA [Aquibacillus koreensis]